MKLFEPLTIRSMNLKNWKRQVSMFSMSPWAEAPI